MNETRDGQWPFAVILSCIDSRTSAELIFDQGLVQEAGELEGDPEGREMVVVLACGAPPRLARARISPRLPTTA